MHPIYKLYSCILFYFIVFRMILLKYAIYFHKIKLNTSCISKYNLHFAEIQLYFAQMQSFRWNTHFRNLYIGEIQTQNSAFILILKINKNMYLEILMKPKNISNYYLRSFLLEISKWAYKNNYVYIKFLIDEKSIKNLNLFLIYKRKLNEQT